MAKALIDELGRAGEKPICSKSFTSRIRRRGFFRSFAEAADFSDILLHVQLDLVTDESLVVIPREFGGDHFLQLFALKCDGVRPRNGVASLNLRDG